MLLLKLAAAATAVYLVVVLLMAVAQDWLLFPRWAAGGGVTPAGAERLALDLPSGDTLVGVHVPRPAAAPAGAALILGFGGNAWSADTMAGYLRSVLPERAIVAFHYRGYGPSTGRPSGGAILDDALAIHDHLAATLAPERIVAVGFSIGAGPAAHLASRRPIAGAILVTPFDSLHALAREHYPWAPVRLLLRHRMEVAEALAAAPVPVALIAAAEDTIVPPRRTAPLREAAEDIVLDRTIEGAGHNDLYDRAAFAEAMRAALDRIEAR